MPVRKFVLGLNRTQLLHPETAQSSDAEFRLLNVMTNTTQILTAQQPGTVTTGGNMLKCWVHVSLLHRPNIRVDLS